MMFQKSSVVLFVLAALVSTFFVLGATTREAQIRDARADYSDKVEDLVKCLADAGYEPRATESPGGVFYNIDVEFPGADSAATWDASQDDYLRALDACTSEDLLRATADLENLTRPTEKEMRTVAETCAPDGEFTIILDSGKVGVEDVLAQEASASQDAAQCIVSAMQEQTRSLVGP